MYLDVIRFMAALMVFLGHASGQNWTGGFLWQTGHYGDTCVIVFFVLSGFVIAYVTDVKEDRWQSYTASRVARLWSVAIPALALTLVVDLVGVQVAPALYIDQPWYRGDYLALRYSTTFFMLHEVWNANLTPGINIPFWSLGFEAFYYLFFGIMWFVHGPRKWWTLFFVALIAGPMITVLFPAWLLGVWVYRRCQSACFGPTVSLALFIAGLLGLALSPMIRAQLPHAPEVLGANLLGRYADAFAFCANVVGAHGLLRNHADTASRLRQVVSVVAAATFPLYLFHRPLIQFFSYAGPDDASSWQRRAFVLGGTLVVVFIATPLCDRFKLSLRQACMRRFSGWS